LPLAPFFVSRRHRALSRGAIYERVRSTARRARIAKVVSPHRLRHTFATDLVRAGIGLVTIRDLLGHHLITSTQIHAVEGMAQHYATAEIARLVELADKVQETRDRTTLLRVVNG
jgi:site-specific recombinase XerD